MWEIEICKEEYWFKKIHEQLKSMSRDKQNWTTLCCICLVLDLTVKETTIRRVKTESSLYLAGHWYRAEITGAQDGTLEDAGPEVTGEEDE